MKNIFIEIPQLAMVLSDSSPFAFIHILFSLQYFVFTRKLFQPRKDFTLRVTCRRREIVFFLRQPMDIAVLKEVFVHREYDWFPVENPKVIVDLGAHFGDTSLYYHAYFPDAKILAVEPSPENYERLVKHVSGIPNIIPVQGAVGATNGEIQLNLVGSSLGHSLIKREGTQHAVTVQQFTLGALLQKLGVTKADIIKFDIEGGEYGLFKNSRPEVYACAYIGEVHPDLVPDGGDFSEAFVAFEVTKIPINKWRYLIRATEKKF